MASQIASHWQLLLGQKQVNFMKTLTAFLQEVTNEQTNAFDYFVFCGVSFAHFTA